MTMQGNGGIGMNAVCREVETFIEEMDKLQKFDDEVFISFYEKVDELQDRWMRWKRQGSCLMKKKKNTRKNCRKHSGE